MDQIFSLAQSLGGGEPSAQGSTEKSAVQPDSGAALTLDPGMLGTIAALMGADASPEWEGSPVIDSFSVQ